MGAWRLARTALLYRCCTVAVSWLWSVAVQCQRCISYVIQHMDVSQTNIRVRILRWTCVSVILTCMSLGVLCQQLTLMSKALTWMISHGCVEFTDTHVGKSLLGRLDTYVKNVDTDVTNKNMEVDTHVKTANTDVTLTPMSRTHAHMDVSCTDIHDKNLYLGALTPMSRTLTLMSRIKICRLTLMSRPLTPMS